jgi:hypothetical protein
MFRPHTAVALPRCPRRISTDDAFAYGIRANATF